MARQKKVIDASIAVKWFLEEPDSEKARVVREDHINRKVLLVAPDLIFTEVLNALRYKQNKESALHEANNSLHDIQLHIERINSYLLEKAIILALQHELSLYDALYAAVAQIHGCALVTNDEKLRKLPLAEPLS